MASISVRLSEKELEQLDTLASNNNMTRSEQVREGLNRYLELCEKIEQGSFIVTLPSVDVKDFYIALRDIEELKQYLTDKHGDSLILPMLECIKNAIQFDTGLKIIQEKPDELISF